MCIQPSEQYPGTDETRSLFSLQKSYYGKSDLCQVVGFAGALHLCLSRLGGQHLNPAGRK